MESSLFSLCISPSSFFSLFNSICLCVSLLVSQSISSSSLSLPPSLPPSLSLSLLVSLSLPLSLSLCLSVSLSLSLSLPPLSLLKNSKNFTCRALLIAPDHNFRPYPTPQMNFIKLEYTFACFEFCRHRSIQLQHRLKDEFCKTGFILVIVKCIIVLQCTSIGSE